MALARYQRAIQDGSGSLNLLTTSLQCEVRRAGVVGTPKAVLYSDRDGTVPLGNPFSVVGGVVAFHAAGGAYNVRVYGAGYDETFTYEPIGTGAEVDADTLLIPGYLYEFETGTTAPPGDGGIRANNADLSAANRLWIHKDTIAAIDVSPRIEGLETKRILITSTNAGEQVGWDVDLVTDAGDYYELVLSEHVGATALAAGRCAWIRDPGEGPAGLDGTFSGDEVALTTTIETLITAYKGKTIILNSATAMALAAQPAATLGADWMAIVTNIGAGTATLNPDGAETVDGAATLVIASGDSLVLSSNGTALRTMLISHSAQPVAKGGTGKTTAPAALDALAAMSVNGHSNVAIAASVSANALTVSLKGANGSDPSADNPVVLAFRDATLTGGAPVLRSVTGALSITVPNGGTMGFANSTPGRLWLVAFDNAGTIRLGLVNCLSGNSIYPLRSGDMASGTSVGTGSDSAHVIYSSAAVSAKALVVLGYLDWSAGLATAGAWASGPTTVQVAGAAVPLPGEVVQVQRTDSGAVATTTTVIPNDDTIPQITEGGEFLTQAITCRAVMNLVAVKACVHLTASTTTSIAAALFKDAGSAALAVSNSRTNNAGVPEQVQIDYRSRAATVSSATFRVRGGQDNAGTLTFNGASGGRLFGGALNSFLEVAEIMA